MREEELFVSVVSIIVFAALGVLWMAMGSRRAVREMEHRERLAMIQRGMVPAPETDPLGFENAIAPFEGDSLRSERWRTAGTLTIGLGLALTLLLSFTANQPNVGVGIGGAFIILGAAILLNGYQLSRSRRPPPRPLAARRHYHDGPFPPIDPPSSTP